MAWEQLVHLVNEMRAPARLGQHHPGPPDRGLLGARVDQVVVACLGKRQGGRGPDLVQQGEEEADSVGFAAAGRARADKVVGPVDKRKAAAAVHLNGSAEAPELILDDIEANDLSKLALQKVVRGNEGVLNLLDLVFFNGILLLLAVDVYLWWGERG